MVSKLQNSPDSVSIIPKTESSFPSRNSPYNIPEPRSKSAPWQGRELNPNSPIESRVLEFKSKEYKASVVENPTYNVPLSSLVSHRAPSGRLETKLVSPVSSFRE